MKKLENLLRLSMALIITIIVGIYTFLCLFVNAHVNIYEQVTLTDDIPILSIIVFLLLVLFISYLFNHYNFNFKKIFIILLFLLSIINVFLIFKWNVQPMYDQQSVLQAASDLRNGNLGMFSKSGYVGIYPHQLGLISIFYFLSYFIGIYNFKAIQIINVVFLLISYFSIYKITDLIFSDSRTNSILMFFILLFVPLSFYVIFVYGNIFGLAFSLLAIQNTLYYLKDRKILNIFFASITILFAIIFKSNYSITLVAIMIFLIIDFIFANKKRLYTGIFMILLVLAYLFSSMAPKMLLESVANIKVYDGIPKIAWIEMGLQDDWGTPGWYDDYSRRTFINNEYDSKKTNQQVKIDLMQTIDKFIKNPKYCISFFYKKTVSQWCDPQFQGPWLLRFTNHYFDSRILYNLLNILQNIILLSAFSYFLLNWKNININSLILGIVFVGGFIFHMFWEAKCQYTITYFWLLIPYAAQGLQILIKNIISNFSNEQPKSFKNACICLFNTTVFKYIIFIVLCISFRNIIRIFI